MVKLREITNDNLEEVLKLRISKAQEEFVSSTAHSLAQAWVYKESAFPFAIYADDVLVGFIMLGYYEAKSQYTLWKFLIDERYQNKGYGRSALKLAIEYLIENFNVSEIYTGVAFKNYLARDLYYSMGFRETGEKDEFQFEMKLSRDKSENKTELLFYNEYEEFYAMAENSMAFKHFCMDAFGEDFSQDGFSDIAQIDMILKYIPQKEMVHILDIGCGNGKMLGYLQKQTGAYIYGFDYSENAIKTAKSLFNTNAEFREGIIGEIEYKEEMFDIIISMDTMYFAKDMVEFISQVRKWLKKEGIFFVGYQEGDVMQKTENAYSTVLAKALEENEMNYEVIDITRQTYDLLEKKRNAAIRHQAEFEEEGYRKWFDMLIGQTESVSENYEQFKQKMARYIYIIKK